MKKTIIKNLFILLLCGVIYFTFAVGSGSNVTTSSSDVGTQSTKSEVSKYKLNEDIYITNSSGKYRLKFTKIYETNDRNQYSDITANRVVIVEYEYENLTLPNDLYISSMDFKVYDKENNVLESYPATETKYASAVATGRKATASEAFALNSSSNYIELDYYDNIFNSKADCRVVIEW